MITETADFYTLAACESPNSCTWKTGRLILDADRIEEATATVHGFMFDDSAVCFDGVNS